MNEWTKFNDGVFVIKLLGVHMDSKLDWNDHIKIVRNKIAKQCIRDE